MAFLMIFVTASDCHIGSQVMERSSPWLTLSSIPLRSASASTLDTALSIMLSKGTVFLIYFMVSASNLDSFNIFCTRKLMFLTSLLAFLISFFLSSSLISGLSLILSRLIITEVIGVLSWWDMSDSASLSSFFSSFECSAASLSIIMVLYTSFLSMDSSSSELLSILST